MTIAQYNAWRHQGSPWSVTSPLQQMIAGLKKTYPKMVYGTLGDESHLTAPLAEDHTPYSDTGWPKVNPYPVVHALDVMGTNGVPLQQLFDYWLPEAKAGRMPWLKYLIWEATLYSVRSTPAWKPQANTGHFDHIHLSARTDTETYQLGSWSPVPGVAPSEDRMIIFAMDEVTKVIYRCDGITCVVVPDDQVTNQTYTYAGLGEWSQVGQKANAVGPAMLPAQPVRPGDPRFTHLKVYSMGFFGQVPSSGGGGGLTPAQVTTIADARIAASALVPPEA